MSNLSSEEKLQQRLLELAALPAGWLDGEGKELPAEGLFLAGAILQDWLDKDYPFPYLYPMPDGNLSAEWDIGPWMVHLTFVLDSTGLEAPLVDGGAMHRTNKALNVEFHSVEEFEAWLKEQI